jgi:hypothetical protein
MSKPVKYFQILTPDSKGILKPFEVNQFGETDSFFKTESDAEKFIIENFKDAQSDGIDKTEAVLIVMPVFLIQYKR